MPVPVVHVRIVPHQQRLVATSFLVYLVLPLIPQDPHNLDSVILDVVSMKLVTNRQMRMLLV